MWVEFKCPICGKDLDDDKSMANFMVCNESSHGTLKFFTGDGCFFRILWFDCSFGTIN
jgi:hypothetical protein